MTQNKKNIWTGKALIFMIFVYVGIPNLFASSAPQQKNSLSGEWQITWKNDSNKEAKLSEWIGTKFILSMIYTNCNNTCLMTLKKLKEFQTVLDREKVTIPFIIVSLDPEEDTPATLASYRRRNDIHFKNWHFLTGKKENVDRLAEAFGFSHWRMDDHIIHDFRVLLFNERGRQEKVLDNWHLNPSEMFSSFISSP